MTNNNPKAVIRRIATENDNVEWLFHCPGCGYGHWFRTSGARPCWAWNGDVEKPTITPSLLVNGSSTRTDSHGRCHSYVSNGNIQFLSDCWHSLKNQTVPLKPFGEDWDGLAD